MWIPIKSFSQHARLFSLVVVLLLSITPLSGQALFLKSGKLSMMSDKGDSTLLLRAVDLIREEQQYYEALFGLRLEDELEIRFYYNPDKVGTRLHATPYWSAGMARAGSEIAIFGRNRNQWLTILKHELFHALLGQNEVNIPVWLNEGLAQWHAGQMDWGSFMELGGAAARGNLIPLVDLDVILSFNHKRASLAYGQALDATRFLIKRQGESILPYLLRADDLSFRERFKAETGGDLIDFEIAWREDLEARFWFFKISRIPGVLWAVSPLIVILAWYLKRRKGKKKLDEWEQEESLDDDPKYFA
jgi:hypothetical protein